MKKKVERHSVNNVPLKRGSKMIDIDQAKLKLQYSTGKLQPIVKNEGLGLLVD